MGVRQNRRQQENSEVRSEEQVKNAHGQCSFSGQSGQYGQKIEAVSKRRLMSDSWLVGQLVSWQKGHSMHNHKRQLLLLRQVAGHLEFHLAF